MTKQTVCLSSVLVDQPGIRHGFFTRQGGVSEGIYGSLNTAYEKVDPAENVDENRGRISAYLGIEQQNLVSLKQTHTTTVHLVNAPYEKGRAPEGDALVTTTPSLALGIMSADCVPVLFVDAHARVIGAAHAGWRGAVAGILENTLQTMTSKGAHLDRIVAAIGPCIWQDSYEIGEDMRSAFQDSDRFFAPGKRDNHWQFDLAGYVLHRLRAAGLNRVTPSPADTCAHPHLYFSNRRRTLMNEPDYGCMLSCITLL